MHIPKAFARLLAFTLAALALAAPAADKPAPWLDNERKFKSDDPALNVRRSEHFRVLWGKGVDPALSGEFDAVSEQVVQANLQVLERIFHRFHDPRPAGLGLHLTGRSNNPAYFTKERYRSNLVFNNTGIWEGGAWGACDEWGFPLFALPKGYLVVDPPSLATAHEYGHTVLINAAGFNDTPYDGMWHESTADWLLTQYMDNLYPGAVGSQPYLSQPHGRNYYDAWLLWECFSETPGYGPAFIARLWTDANGSSSKGAEYMFDAMARLDTSGATDPYNAVKDVIGRCAARNVTWDYERGAFFRMHSPRSRNALDLLYRRGMTELSRRAGDSAWFRGPYAHAPMQGGFNIVPVALPGKTGAPYPVSIDFKPLWDPLRRSDWRATLVAVNDQGEPRYSAMWNGGVNSITLGPDENLLYLAVAATPDFMGYEGFSQPRATDPPLQPQAYELAFVDTRANAFEARPEKPAAAGKPHPNGGGFVADSAQAAPTAYIGPDAQVLGKARVLGNARLEDFAVVRGDAVVEGNALLSGHALVQDRARVTGHAKVRDRATVQGEWKISEDGRVLESAFLRDKGELSGHATIKGVAEDYGNPKVRGYAIKDADCSNGVSIDKQVLMCWVWDFDQKYADSQPDCQGLYCNYRFLRDSPVYAVDTYGVLHGYLMGAPETVALDDPRTARALRLNGKDQYIELKRDVADFRETTIAAWIRWNGGAADQRLFHFGDGAARYAFLTPRDGARGRIRFVISDNGKGAEQELLSPAPCPPDTWVHVAVTLRDGTGTLFVNGRPVAANPGMTLRPDQVLPPNTLAGNACTFIGRGPAGNYFDGCLTDFRVYSLPQSPATLAELGSGLAQSQPAIRPVPALDAPPLPAPRFLVQPAPAGPDAVRMAAAKAPAAAVGVEYRFQGVGAGAHDSGWISSNQWTDCRLAPGPHAYTVRMRDRLRRETPASETASCLLDKDATPPAPADFACAPAGASTSTIRMAARKAADLSPVQYRFTRSDGHSSGWQSSPAWTDRGLRPGSRHAYSVQVRDAAGNQSAPSPEKRAVARDDTPPARYARGEWQTVPYALVDNRLSMRAMSVTGENACPRIETDTVEYLFDCVRGGGPGSGWQASPFFQTPPLKAGAYAYRFKIRDKSPQRNQTPWSSAETASVTVRTGYHDYPLAALKQLQEGVLVRTTGRITAVDNDYYTLADGASSIRVSPRTVGGKTKPEFKGRTVRVRGCVWIVNNLKCITWADVE